MNTSDFEKILDLYDYRYPESAIAQSPASPRDSAKLAVLDTKDDSIVWTDFSQLPRYVEPGSVVVFNRTKVLPARLELIRNETGGRVRVLYVSHDANAWRVLSDRPLPEGVDFYAAQEPSLRFRSQGKRSGEWVLLPSFALSKTFSVLEKYGAMPLPPYIKKSPLTEEQRKKEYQTVFAKERGSVAAPTASLHFTKRLMADLKKKGATAVYVTLHVNLGTFATLTAEALEKKKLHEEWFEIPSETASLLEDAKKDGRAIIAVGTTVVRALESAGMTDGKFARLSGSTDIFLRPPYRPSVATSIITNFHVPRSSLLMLVSCFAQREKLLALYREAIRRGFKLFSFGDGMFIK